MTRRPRKAKLKAEERKFLEEYVSKGTKKARSIARAKVLLLADEGHNNAVISLATRVHRQTIWSIKRRFLKEGLPTALEEAPRSGKPRTYKGREGAVVIATACTEPPEGSKRWTLILLVEELRKKKGFEKIASETIRLILKKAKRSLG